MANGKSESFFSSLFFWEGGHKHDNCNNPYPFDFFCSAKIPCYYIIKRQEYKIYIFLARVCVKSGQRTDYLLEVSQGSSQTHGDVMLCRDTQGHASNYVRPRSMDLVQNIYSTLGTRQSATFYYFGHQESHSQASLALHDIVLKSLKRPWLDIAHAHIQYNYPHPLSM